MGKLIRDVSEAEFVADWLPIFESIFYGEYWIEVPGDFPDLKQDGWQSLPIIGGLRPYGEAEDCLIRKVLGIPSADQFDVLYRTMDRLGLKREFLFVSPGIGRPTYRSNGEEVQTFPRDECRLYEGDLHFYDHMKDYYFNATIFDSSGLWAISANPHDEIFVLSGSPDFISTYIDQHGGLATLIAWFQHYEAIHSLLSYGSYSYEAAMIDTLYDCLNWPRPGRRVEGLYFTGEPCPCDTPELVAGELQRLNFKP
ncbi:MAG: hypothetical protein ACPGNT_02505 [Rhodospirillales bacterium]